MKLISHRSSTIASGCKTLVSLSATLTLNLALISSAQAAEFADFIFLVDESGSMGGEHSWLTTTVGDLDIALQEKGVGTGTVENRYGLVGFGGTTGKLGRSLSVGGVGGSLFGSATELATSTNFLVTTGSFEDGYSAIDYALNNYSFRDGAAVNFVLVTDEDRDNGNDSLNFDNILSRLQAKNALLNVVVNHQMTDKNGRQVIGADRDGNVFLADGIGGYSTIADGLNSSPTQGTNQFGYPGQLNPWTGKPISPASYVNTTKSDYVDMAWATGNSNISGAAWDLNLLRSGGATADSFNAAFVDIKATEAWQQTGNGVEEKQKIPEPTTVLGLLGVAALGIRKRSASPSGSS